MNGSGAVFINFSVPKHLTNNKCIISIGLLGALHFDCKWSFRSVQPRVAGHLERKCSSLQLLLVIRKDVIIASIVAGHLERK